MILVLPIAGKSSRFKETRPKWMLTHPNGNLMLTESIRGLDISKCTNVLIIALIKHEEKYCFSDSLIKEFQSVFNLTPTIILLDKQTNSQSETIYLGLKKAKINDSILIKDCDNFFILKNINYDNNFVSIIDLQKIKEVKAYNKSYVQIGNNNNVVNIAEKRVIGNLFCCGSYFFKNSEDFMRTYECIIKDEVNSEIYISHIIYKMILDGQLFFTEEANGFIDWGTYNDWIKFKSEFKTLFIDIDGVLVENSSEHFIPKWGTTKGITANIEIINTIYYSNKSLIILTTSRKEEYRKVTINQLIKENIKYHRLIMDLPVAKRILINDFSTTNPYPSSIAINLSRNNANLKEYLNNNVT